MRRLNSGVRQKRNRGFRRKDGGKLKRWESRRKAPASPKKWIDGNYYSGTVKKEGKRRRGDEKREMKTVKVDGEGEDARGKVMR